ncbi:MAG TPA: hypothetical protein VF631_07855 [Allosphingosinicella sp.]|uniref:YunG family protein n=1 Tax=Allosphingosinicella sp. TaxID=2823234 RepID=UPI002F2AD777
MTEAPVTIDRLRSALEASWDAHTAYQGAVRPGNPAFGQCYPTARVVQWFFPESEIACGDVDTGSSIECHFWNVRVDGDRTDHIDLSWEQFPPGSAVLNYRLLDRNALGDSPPTLARCALLLERVHAELG